MFSKWIFFLLKSFDICGFYTEVTHLQNPSKRACQIFLLHAFWAFAIIIMVVMFSMHTSGVLPYMVNVNLQNTCGAVDSVIIIESFTQRKVQQQFWQIYQCIYFDKPHQKPYFGAFLIKLMTFFTAITPIAFYLVYNSLSVETVVYFWYCFAYFFLFIVYQVRIFYYLFYLELIKYELIAIRNALKDVAFVSGFKRNSSPIAHHTNERLRESNQIKAVYKHYSQICELNDCINQIFGWSNFVTILYCFGLPLTDANWAYTSFGQWSMEYTIGKLFNVNLKASSIQ